MKGDVKSFAGYEMEGELGRGSTATVYRARCPQGNLVCLKVFHTGPRGEIHKRRIEQEGDLASQLRHPHIVRVHRVLKQEEGAALVLDLVDGEDLQSFQRHFPYLFPELGLWVVLPLLRALEYAHKKGVIHRDLKPANLLVGKDGLVRVADFGLAKVVGSQLTQTSAPLLGTVDFMSPEQARGDVATPASDLYSVGAILYFLVTGTPPISGTDTLATLKGIQEGTIEPPQEKNPKVSPALSRLVLRALSLRPEDRFGTAEEFSQACESYLTGLGLSESRLTLGDYQCDPSSFTLDALKIAAETLIHRCEDRLAEGDTNGFLETLAHLSLKAPSSPALIRLNEAFGQGQQRRKGWVWAAAAVGVFAVVLGAGYWASQDRVPVYSPFGPPVRHASVAPIPPAASEKVGKAPPSLQGTVLFKVGKDVRVFWKGRLIPTDRPLREKPGKYFVLFEKKGFAPIREEVEVKADENTVIRVR